MFEVVVSLVYKIRGRNSMASRTASREIVGANRNRVPPGKKKSNIPIRITRLSSSNDGKLSSGAAMVTKLHLLRNSVEKLGNKRPSRIPIKTECKKTRAEKKELGKNTTSAKHKKSSGKDSGIVEFFCLVFRPGKPHFDEDSCRFLFKQGKQL